VTATKTTQKSLVEALVNLEQKVAEAVDRREATRVERQLAQRAVRVTEAQFHNYEERVGANEQAVDPAHQGELRAAIDAAREAASSNIWDSRLAGADRAVREAEAERDAFGLAHFAEIAAEEALKDGPARDRLEAAFEELQAAEAEYAARVRRWHYLAPFGRLDVDDLPGLPTRGDPGEVQRRFADGFEVATPRSLLADPDAESEDA
jgi:hypothetical protein